MEDDPQLSRYAFGYGVLNAADYGAPQFRRRGIFVAVKGADEVPWPPPGHPWPDDGPAIPNGP